METNQSEVAALRRQIALEFQAAEQAHHGFAQSARHSFIMARYNQIGGHQQRLAALVGESEAMRMGVEVIESA